MNNPIKVKRFVREFKPIEIKEPFKTETIEFSDPTEFTKYYREHEDEFSNMSTYKLNMKYKIPGYKISQKKDKDPRSEIRLVKDYSKKTEVIEESQAPPPNELISKIEELEKRITNIETYLSSNQ